MSKIIWFLLFLPSLVFSAPSVLVYDVTNKHVVAGGFENHTVSIASLTKLMTVYTVLKQGQDLDEKLQVVNKKTSNTKLRPNKLVTRRELINLSLISSDNLAALTLAHNFPGGISYFVHQMNQHAFDLEMYNSRFVEPTGLNPMNYSNIQDVLTLTTEVNNYKIFNEAASTQKEQKASIDTVVKNKTKTEVIKYYPTIKYFGRENFLIIKTGFTKAAGFCVTILVETNKRMYNIIVLGAKTKLERQKLVESSLAKIDNI